MKVFKSFGLAKVSLNEKDSFFLNGECPYDSDNKLCGSWCALFHLNKADGNTSTYVIMGCKAGEKRLFVEEIVEG